MFGVGGARDEPEHLAEQRRSPVALTCKNRWLVICFGTWGQPIRLMTTASISLY
jgi:hypothetical protein